MSVRSTLCTSPTVARVAWSETMQRRAPDGSGVRQHARRPHQDPGHLDVWDLGVGQFIEPEPSLVGIAADGSSRRRGKEDVGR